MPGIFGCVNVSPGLCHAINTRFNNVWAESVSIAVGEEAVMGGHAHWGSVLHENPEHIVVRDGEAMIYAPTLNGADPGAILQRSAGTVATFDKVTKQLAIHSDASGLFPLYYAEVGGGMVFSSLLNVLASVLRPRPDPIGVLEFVREGYNVDGRTILTGVRRLQPGEGLRFSAHSGIQRHQTATTWVNITEVSSSEAAEEAWSLLRNRSELTGTLQVPGNRTLMMSGGWDSRTLLAAYRSSPERIRCYSHGDLQSRELSIVHSLCDLVGAPLQTEPIDARVLNSAALDVGFSRTDSVVFPHWHRAGCLVAAAGGGQVSAGILGEVLGGHYGPAMLRSGIGKIYSVATSLLGIKGGVDPKTPVSAQAHLMYRNVPRPWYLGADIFDETKDAKSALNDGVLSALARLEERGVRSGLPLLEAYITEHRGIQYIGAQLLSCRAYLDVTAPFAAKQLYQLASTLPLHSKIHNRVNQTVLKHHSPDLLTLPLAATLTPAAFPIAVQEASRLLRKAYETAHDRISKFRSGHARQLRFGWVNFEFMGEGRTIRDLIDGLNAEIWDDQALLMLAERVETGDATGSLHPAYDQLSKIMTVDKILSAQ